MYINVCGFNVTVPKPCGNCLDVASIGKKHGGTGMPQTVKFQMTDIVPLEEVIELLGWCLRIHDQSVFFGKNVIQSMPGVSHKGNVTVLLNFIIPESVT